VLYLYVVGYTYRAVLHPPFTGKSRFGLNRTLLNIKTGNLLLQNRAKAKHLSLQVKWRSSVRAATLDGGTSSPSS
jgi:hypothetical protein